MAEEHSIIRPEKVLASILYFQFMYLFDVADFEKKTVTAKIRIATSDVVYCSFDSSKWEIWYTKQGDPTTKHMLQHAGDQQGQILSQLDASLALRRVIRSFITEYCGG